MSINKEQWEKEGFLLEITPQQYLVGAGPFIASDQPDQNKWSLFHPPFFFPLQKAVKNYWYIPSTVELFSKKQVLTFLDQYKESKNINSWQWEDPCYFQFQDFFSVAMEKIEKSKLQKVVPAFFEKTVYTLKPQDIGHLIYLLISRSAGGIAYAWWSGQRAIIGSTPEYLFRKEELYVQTMALAGTAADSQHKLQEDLKEKWEHELVVEEIKKLLTGLGKYRFSDTYTYSVGNLSHLRTDFKLRLNKDISFQELCCILHPTPALGGSPKEEALKLLTEFHSYSDSRNSFGAPFGVVKQEKAFCVVAIRNIQFMEGKAYLGSGCGLVKESVMEREWDELKRKRLFIKNILFDRGYS